LIVPLADFRDRFPGLCDRLLQTKLRERIGHAYLFIADDAAFIERFAAAWAQVCACQKPSSNGDACGACRPCELLTARNYPELYEVRPQSKSRHILVGDVRSFEHQLGLATEKGCLKIGLVVDADCMGEEAQNAFLKSLEEPSAQTLLLLLTTQPRRLLPTIRSRCQIVSVLQNRKSYDLARKWEVFSILARLRRNAGAATAVAAASRLSAVFGSLREQAREAIGDAYDERWDAVAADDKALRKRLEEAHEAKIEAEYRRLRQEIADALQAWFLQQCLVAAGTAPELLPQPELLEDAGEVVQEAPPIAWEEADYSAACLDTLLRCLAGNVNERLALEAFCLSVCERRS